MNPTLWLLAGAAAVGAVWLLCHLRARRRIKARVRQLTQFLEAVNCGRESPLTRCEDAFSLLEDELYKTVGELRIAKESAQRERLRQADNLADIAHQLKTPLTSMSLMTQLLADGADDTQREYTARIDSQLTRLQRLTASLLTMARLDAGAIEFVRQPIPFAELMARASEPLEESLRSRGQRFLVEESPLSISCDPTWTVEALINLIKNCGEHTPRGGLITARCTANPLYAEILIEDSGHGFDPEELPRLFSRFYRGKGAAPNSIGIGLALARSIAEEQDGILRAENRTEGGARFILRFYH